MTVVMYNINGKGRATVKGTANANKRNYKLIFQDNPSFDTISKVKNTFFDNKESLDIVMPMYNLLEYSEYYSMTSNILWK